MRSGKCEKFIIGHGNMPNKLLLVPIPKVTDEMWWLASVREILVVTLMKMLHPTMYTSFHKVQLEIHVWYELETYMGCVGEILTRLTLVMARNSSQTHNIS